MIVLTSTGWDILLDSELVIEQGLSIVYLYYIF